MIVNEYFESRSGCQVNLAQFVHIDTKVHTKKTVQTTPNANVVVVVH